MIQFQKTYTDKKQSERLLELGVPADSADMLYFATGNSKENYNRGIFYETPVVLRRDNILHEPTTNTFPCWSVGRLMAIYFISKGLDYWSPQFKKYQIENSAEYFVAIIENNIKDLDFSKLED